MTERRIPFVQRLENLLRIKTKVLGILLGILLLVVLVLFIFGLYGSMFMEVQTFGQKDLFKSDTHAIAFWIITILLCFIIYNLQLYLIVSTESKKKEYMYIDDEIGNEFIALFMSMLYTCGIVLLCFFSLVIKFYVLNY
jgi:hypothetical protein